MFQVQQVVIKQWFFEFEKVSGCKLGLTLGTMGSHKLFHFLLGEISPILHPTIKLQNQSMSRITDKQIQISKSQIVQIILIEISIIVLGKSLTLMRSDSKNQHQTNRPSVSRKNNFNQYRRSIGTAPFPRNSNLTEKLLPQKLPPRRPSLGKIPVRVNVNCHQLKNNQALVSNKPKSISDKSSLFDQYLSPNQILKQFRMMSHIGKGCFSTVSLAIHRESNTNYALKTYQKIDSLEQYRLDSIKREIKHLKNLNHENVVKLFYVFKDKKKILLLMDNGGKQSISGLLRKKKSFSEDTAKFYFKQILQGVSYCHGKGVCHRDIKPENILVDDLGQVKIIDFGFSATTKNKLTTYCGTPPFMCPEITKKVPYSGAAADAWALGVLLYSFIFGKLPFRANNEAELSRLIQQGKYPNKQTLSKPLKQLLEKMLQCDPEKRASVKDLLSDPWLR